MNMQRNINLHTFVNEYTIQKKANGSEDTCFEHYMNLLCLFKVPILNAYSNLTLKSKHYFKALLSDSVNQ